MLMSIFDNNRLNILVVDDKSNEVESFIAQINTNLNFDIIYKQDSKKILIKS
jgi:hypothetical protein